jgi:hypothetical protein
MTPLDHLRLWFVGLDSDVQYEIAFALVPALEDNFKGRRFQSERDFIKALEAWLAPTRFAPRNIGKVVSATAMIDYAFGEADTLENKILWEQIRESWQALKRERIGKEAVAEWSAAVLAEKLGAIQQRKASGRPLGTEPVDADADLEVAARANLAAAEGEADRTLRLVLAGARGVERGPSQDLLRLCPGLSAGRAWSARCGARRAY